MTIFAILVMILEASIATYVATRAAGFRPARFFTLLAAGFIIISISARIDLLLPGTDTAPINRVLSPLALCLMSISMLLVFSALFVPQWWEGRQPIRWIILPYLLALAALLIDRLSGINALVAPAPAALVLLTTFSASWLVHLGTLISGYRRERRLRPAIVIIGGSILFSLTLNRLGNEEEVINQIFNLLQVIPLFLAIAYAILHTYSFETTKVALDQAMQAMSEAVAVVSNGGEITYANQQARQLGLAPNTSFAAGLLALSPASPEIRQLLVQQQSAGERPISAILAVAERSQVLDLELSPVRDGEGRIQGLLFLGRDITEVQERTAQLERERERLAVAVAQLEAEQRGRSELAATLQALSLPVIPVLEGVLVLPLIGAFDATRIHEFLDVLLRAIEDERAHLVLLDVTGVPLLDSAGAAGLIQGVQAAALLGARCVLVGMRPEIAQSLVSLGAGLETISTAANLQQALQRQLA